MVLDVTDDEFYTILSGLHALIDGCVSEKEEEEVRKLIKKIEVEVGDE